MGIIEGYYFLRWRVDAFIYGAVGMGLFWLEGFVLLTINY